MPLPAAPDRRRPEHGATAVEYSLIVVFIAAVIVGIVATLGGQVLADFQTVVGSF